MWSESQSPTVSGLAAVELSEIELREDRGEAAREVRLELAHRTVSRTLWTSAGQRSSNRRRLMRRGDSRRPPYTASRNARSGALRSVSPVGERQLAYREIGLVAVEQVPQAVVLDSPRQGPAADRPRFEHEPIVVAALEHERGDHPERSEPVLIGDRDQLGLALLQRAP